MPRHCILCGKRQSKSFAVFSFPHSHDQTAAWIDIIRCVIPEFAKGINWYKEGLKNGICQLHFYPHEFSNGKKCRLQKNAIPSINIPQITGKKHTTHLINIKEDKIQTLDNRNKNFEAHFDNMKQNINNNCKTTESDVHNNNNHFMNSKLCSIEIKSPLKIEPREEIIYENSPMICFFCRSNLSRSSGISLFENGNLVSKETILKSVANILEVCEEKIINSGSFICTHCFLNFNEIYQLKVIYEKKLASLREVFLTACKLREESDYSCYLEVEGEKLNTIKKKFSLLADNCNERKSKRLKKFSNKLFTCDECPENFSTLGSLLFHAQMHEEVNLNNNSNSDIMQLKKKYSKYSCKECLEVFTLQSDFTSHLKSYHRYFDCSYCGRYITTKARLDHHLYKFHGIGKGKCQSYSCNLCERSFTSRPGLRYHIKVFHKRGEIYTCEICEKKFYYKILYNSHKLYSHGEKTIVCEKCGEMFFTISKLNSHINAVHRNALSWQCKICNEKFTTASSFRHHKIFKHKNTKYKCTFCGLQFKKNSSLTKHLRKHGSFSCQECKITFKNSGYYTTHMLNKHNLKLSKKLKVKKGEAQIDLGDSSTRISEDSLKKENMSEFVINDILITSDSFDNSNQELNLYPIKNNKEIKTKSCSSDRSSMAIMSNDVIQFRNVDNLTVEVQDEDSLKLNQDVELLNVEVLENINCNNDVPSIDNKQEYNLTQNLKNTDLINILCDSESINSNSQNLETEMDETYKEDSSSFSEINQLSIIENMTVSNKLQDKVLSSTKTDTLTSLEPLVTSPNLNTEMEVSNPALYSLPLLESDKTNDWDLSPI